MTLQYRMASKHLQDAYCTQFGNSNVNLIMEHIDDNSHALFFSFVLYSNLPHYIPYWFCPIMLALITIERPQNLYLHSKMHLISLYFNELCGGLNTSKIQRFSHCNENNVKTFIMRRLVYCAMSTNDHQANQTHRMVDVFQRSQVESSFWLEAI